MHQSQSSVVYGMAYPDIPPLPTPPAIIRLTARSEVPPPPLLSLPLNLRLDSSLARSFPGLLPLIMNSKRPRPLSSYLCLVLVLPESGPSRNKQCAMRAGSGCVPVKPARPYTKKVVRGFLVLTCGWFLHRMRTRSGKILA